MRVPWTRTRAVTMVVAIAPTAALVSAQAPSSPFRSTVRAVVGADLVQLEGGMRVRLQGISLPTPVVRPATLVGELRQWLVEQLVGRELLVEPDGEPPVDDRADCTAVLRVARGMPSINAMALADGRAIFGCRTAAVASLRELREAAARAQRERRGWFGLSPRPPVEEVGYLNGAVIGMHHRDPAQSYERELDELARLGFRKVSLIFSGFLHDVTSWRIDRHHPRTVTDRRLVDTIRYAREEKGMTVMLLPIVLLEEAGDDDWRGTIRPDPEERFWLAYDSFLAHYLDIAENTGVEIFSIGSEFGSLEDRTETWYRLIDNARGRYTGLLTYSANWDHVHVPRFFDRLDAVGMTAYFSLTKTDDPTDDELRAAWARVAGELAGTLAKIDRPVFFTELGYASQDGINKDPWNYFIARDRIDLAEQAQCFEIALEMLPGIERLVGAFWFEYFGDGGRGDHGYSPRGKPALAVWRKWAAHDSELAIRRSVPSGR